MADRHLAEAGSRSAVPYVELWLDDDAVIEDPTFEEAGIAPTAPRGVRPPWSGGSAGGTSGGRRRRSSRGRLALLGLVAAAAVAVPLAVALSPGAPGSRSSSGTAKHRVIAALNATIDSGSFDMRYSQTPPTGPPSGGGSAGLSISGQGVIDTDPFAMVADAQGPDVTIRADGTDVWEMGGGDDGLAPGSTTGGPGSPLDGFAGLVEGTLGQRQGAVSMMELSSPTGYLEIDQNAITAADEIGTGDVDGTAVTVYQVTLDPAEQAVVPGATAEETSAIQSALALLAQQGYTGTTVQISIDAAGFVRRTVSTANFSDGVTQTTDVTFWNFGCAGQVLMPGQSGSGTAPAGCTSPDPSAAGPASGTGNGGSGSTGAGSTGAGNTGIGASTSGSGAGGVGTGNTETTGT